MATSQMYREGLKDFCNKQIDYAADNFSAILLKNTYTPDVNAHTKITNLTGELTGGGYARVALAGKSVNVATNGVVKLLASTITFSGITNTNVLYLVIARNSGSDATSTLLSYVQFDAVINPTAQNVTFNVATDGVVTLTLV